MSTERNKETARKFIEAFNQKDLDGLAACVRPDVANHALMPGLPPGLEGWKLMAQMFFTAFPDMQVAIDDLVAEGDRVVARWTAQGTHQGELMGIPATGKQVTLMGISIDRYDNKSGLSVEHWENFDTLGMLQQLGAVPGPQQAKG
ncbi:MAG: ester cyclase [Chloroflexi bacterium]|nr:ester cyclase [Chloroflexota bacterium]